MATVINELEESRRYNDSEDERQDRAERRYLINGSENEAEILTAVEGFAPQFVARPQYRIDEGRIGTLERNTIAIRNEEESETFSAVVVWEDCSRVNDKYNLTTTDVMWDTGGERQKVYEGIAEDGWPKSVDGIEKGKVPDGFRGTPAGLPDGIPNILDLDKRRGNDIPVGVVNYRERHLFAAQGIDINYAKTVAELRGKTNQFTFRGQPKGEFLFLGANARQRNNTSCAKWEIEYLWQLKPTKFSVVVEISPTSNIVFDVVGGHEFVQVLTRPTMKSFVIAGNTYKYPVPVVVAAFVHKQHEEADFALLNIGN